MMVDIVEIGRNEENKELQFSILDLDTGNDMGFLFTVGNHIAYEVWPEYRGNNVATTALRAVTTKIDRPVLEIKFDNVASKRVALKAGYSLTGIEDGFEMYEYSGIGEKNPQTRK